MRKFLTILSLVLVGLLTVTTIVLAIVKVNFYNPINKDVTRMTVYRDGKSIQTYIGQDDEYKEILELHEKSLKENVLGTMFQGYLNFEAEVTTRSTKQSISTLTSNSENMYIKFEYTEQQTLIVNGEKFEDENLSISSERLVTYKALLLSVENNSDLTQVKLYVINNNKDANNTTTYNYEISVLCKQTNLFNYLADIKQIG